MLLKHLVGGSVLQRLRREAMRYGVEDGQLQELIGFLNTIGALHRKRSYVHRVKALGKQASHLLVGIRYVPLSWRRRPSLALLCIGTLRATWPVSIGSTAVSIAAITSTVFPPLLTLFIYLYGVLLFLISLIIHEAAHIVIIRRQGIDPRLFQSGMRFGIIHPRLTAKTEVISAPAGPIAGITSSVCLGWIAAISMNNAHLMFIGILIATVHLFALLPWYGDGLTLRTARRRRMHE